MLKSNRSAICLIRQLDERLVLLMNVRLYLIDRFGQEAISKWVIVFSAGHSPSISYCESRLCLAVAPLPYLLFLLGVVVGTCSTSFSIEHPKNPHSASRLSVVVLYPCCRWIFDSVVR